MDHRVALDRCGVSVTEVLVATAVVSIALVALAAAMPSGTRGVEHGRRVSVATFLASARLEELRAAEWAGTPAVDALGLSAASDQAPHAHGAVTFADEAALPAPFTRYRRTVRIRSCEAPPGCTGVLSPDLRQLTVTVSHHAPAPRVSVSVITVVAKR